MAMDTFVKNMEHLSLPQDPSPSGLLLQGGKVSSRSSSELSSSEAVWLVRKWKENERVRKAGKMLKASRPSFINDPTKVSVYSVAWGLYTAPYMQNYKNI